MRSIHLAALSLLITAPLAADFRSAWPLDGRLGGINSQVPGRSAEDNIKSSGGELELHFDPILGWTDSRWLILPALDIETNSANTILKVDDDRFVFLSQATTGLELGTAFKRTPDQRFGFKLFAGGFQGKEAVNEELSNGQYNYQDGGIALDWRQKWDTATPFRSTLGLRATNRKYPNWQSLDPAARREKDQDITKLYTDLEWLWSDLHASTVAGVSVQSVAYPDAVVVDATGTTLAGVKRKDSVFDLSVAMPFQLGRHSLEPRARIESWASNLTQYDSQNNVFTDHYNAFGELGGGLGYSYDFEGPWWVMDSPQVTVDLDLSQRAYSNRLARTDKGLYPLRPDGSLRGDKEEDFARAISLGYNSAFSQHWGLYVKFVNNYAQSNNDDQSSSLYNYTFNTFSLGLNFVY